MQLKNRRLFQSAIAFLIIASFFICIACNISESNSFYFATSVNNETTLGAQYLVSSASFDFDFAGEETLRSASSSYSSITHSLMRSQRNPLHSYMQFLFLLTGVFFILTNNLRSYGYQDLPRQYFSCLRIAKFIEHSDGKK